MSHSDGYVTEISYTNHICREQGPAWLSLAALWSGADAPRLDREFTLLDLGCGHGGNAVLAACLFPQAQFLADDFMPIHVESACRLRDEVGITNLAILADSFAELARRDDLPACDFIVAHGIFSWVSAENQAHIVDLVRRLLKPGGLFYVSYNSAVGWAGMGALRQFLAAHAAQDHGPLADRLARALDAAEGFARAGCGIPTLEGLGHLVAALRREDPAYLVHEYLNENWHPLYPTQVAARMAQAGLSFVGPAQLADALDTTAWPPTLESYMGGCAAGSLRELMGDIALHRAFRGDIYGRDVTRLAGAALDRRRDAVRFVLAAAKEQCQSLVPRPFHAVQLDRAAQVAILDRLAAGTADYATLRALPDMRPLGPDGALYLLTLMIQAGQICAVPGDAPIGDADRLNRALVARARHGGHAGFLAAPAIAGAVVTGAVDTLMLGAFLDGEADPAARVWQDIAALGRPLSWGDAVIAADKAGSDLLHALAERFRHDLAPRLRLFGILPG